MRDARVSAWRALALASLTAAALAPGLSAQEWRDFRAARQAGGLRALEVEVRYGAGNVLIEPSEERFLYDVRLRYDGERYVPVRAFAREDGVGRFRLAVPTAAGASESARVRIDDWDLEFDLEDLSRDREELGNLHVRLHPSVPTRLKLGIGAARARLDLGGLSLAELTLMTGASDTELRFEEPNEIVMERLSLTSGAAEFSAEGLGNARFEAFEFQGVIGAVLLDFGGRWERDARARIKIGLGDLTIRVPRELGVRIERNAWFASLEAAGFREVDGAYLSPNWDSAEHRLEIELSTGFGTVEIERI